MANTITELQTLDINYLSQSQYDELVASDQIDENAIYMTPDENLAVDYTAVVNKPQINGVELVGNKTTAELGINSAVWGNITGTLSNQTDLNTALDNKLEGVSVNGTPLTVSNHSVDVTVPTKTSDLTNDGNGVTPTDPFVTESVTDTLSSRIDAIVSEGGEPNVIEIVKVNGAALPVTSKAVDVIVPTKTSDLTNDSDFVSDASYVHTDNNFTTTLKNKLDGIEDSADVNVIEVVKQNGTALTITNKSVDVTVPTKTSDLINDSGFITSASVPTKVSELTNDSNFQNATQVSSAISTHNSDTSAHSDIRTAVSDEASARTAADNNLQDQIDAIAASSDVVDIVGTYAELQNYDTTKLHNNDIVKVLVDSTHNGSTSYYRWVIPTTGTASWSYVGSEGPYYTVSETDVLLGNYVAKTRKVGAVDLSADVKLSGSFSGTSKSISVSGTPTGNVTISKGTGTANYTPSGSNAKSAVTISPTTTSVYSMSSAGSVTAGKAAAFTQGSDSFTANTPTVIDTTKFSGGSFIRGSFNGGSFTQGTDTFVAPVLTFTPNSGSTGNLGISWTAGSFTQGSDSFTAATHGNDTFTAAKLNTGFYTAGSAASFTQGEDSFTSNTPTAVTLPSRTQVNDLWNGYNTGAANTYAAAQTFTGDGVELKGSFSGTSFTSTGTYEPEGSVTVTASH